MKKRNNIKGFTVLELMVVVGIVGILSAVGIPLYIGYADSSKVVAVKNNLRAIYLQQQEYYRRNAAYYESGSTCTDSSTALNTNLFEGQTILVSDDFYYCTTQTTVDDFIASAVENGGDNRTFTINEANTTNF